MKKRAQKFLLSIHRYRCTSIPYLVLLHRVYSTVTHPKSNCQLQNTDSRYYPNIFLLLLLQCFKPNQNFFFFGLHKEQEWVHKNARNPARTVFINFFKSLRNLLWHNTIIGHAKQDYSKIKWWSNIQWLKKFNLQF